MHWHGKFMKLARLRGEWWLIDGRAAFCDADVGEDSHESMVVNHVRGQYSRDEFDTGSGVDWEGFEKKLMAEEAEEQGVDLAMATPDEAKRLVNDALAGLGMSQIEVAIARGGKRVDVRLWAEKNLGWIRVRGSSVETWTLDQHGLDSLASGLGDAYGEEDQSELVFDIDVIAGGTIYRGVPIAVLESGNPENLLPYRDRYLTYSHG